MTEEQPSRQDPDLANLREFMSRVSSYVEKTSGILVHEIPKLTLTVERLTTDVVQLKKRYEGNGKGSVETQLALLAVTLDGLRSSVDEIRKDVKDEDKFRKSVWLAVGVSLLTSIGAIVSNFVA